MLAPGSSDLKVLHLSDLHMTPRRRRLQDWVASLAATHPDLVVVTGDFLAHRDAVDPVMAALDPLLDVPGVFVLGSNDYYAPRPINPLSYLAGPSDLHPDRGELPWRDLVERLTSAGWQHLGNASTVIEAAGRVVDVRGVDDPHIERDDYALVAGSPRNDADLAIGVAHAPYLRVVDAMAADGIDVMLAGHTHGGQVRVPGIGALVTNCDLDRRQARGLSRVERPLMEFAPRDHCDMWLHVSAGLGTSPYAPIRFACPPEATLLTLTARG
jgi:predicted MPP superfamily phosphohydrolase